MNMKPLALAIGAVLSLLIPGNESVFATDNRINLIQQRGELVVCHMEHPPWASKDPETGKGVGVSVESAKHIAWSLGVDYKPIEADFWTRISFVESGNCDIAMTPIYPTMEYATRVLFSDPVKYEFQSVVVHMDSSLQTHKDVDQEGVTVVFGPSLEAELFAERFYKKATVNRLINPRTYSAYFLEVTHRRADALLYDNFMIREFIKQNPRMNLRIIDDIPLDPDGYSYAVQLGEYHLINVINFLLKGIKHGGRNYELYQRYQMFTLE